MAIVGVASGTGLGPLPDIGTLAYNGVTFSCLYTSHISGNSVQDNAGRTVKFMEYTLTVSAMVTLSSAVNKTIDDVMQNLRLLLEQDAGTLTFTGKGFGNITVNAPGGGGLRDLNWGPKPKTISFQPLGQSRAATVEWSITFCIPELIGGAVNQGQVGAKVELPVVQYNMETAVTFDDDGYSGLRIAGTLEIPLTRNSVNDRIVATTVDAFRQRFLDIQVDLTRFEMPRREFNISRDKRTCEWSFTTKELPPMGLAPGATSSRGTFSFRPEKSGPGLVKWLCSLRCTYVIRKDFPRRLAWQHFIGFLRFRMMASSAGNLPGIGNIGNVLQQPNPPALDLPPPIPKFVGQFLGDGLKLLKLGAETLKKVGLPPFAGKIQRCLIVHFGGDEGLMQDSKQVTFEASYRLFTTFSHILLATGLWRWDNKAMGGNLWAQSVQNISGWKSWLVNQLDPAAEVIVDMGGGGPVQGKPVT